MTALHFGNHTIRFDLERTRSAYARIESGDADRCGCIYCQNFAAQRETIYPEAFLSLLLQLGIDWKKEGEVTEIAGVYNGWFHFAGSCEQTGDSGTDATRFRFRFASPTSFPNPPADFGDVVGAVEFYATLPWVLAGIPRNTVQPPG